MNSKQEKNVRATAFVSFILGQINRDKGIAAALRRADNSATEYQSWDILAAFNIQLDKPYERLPFAIIAAAIAKAKIDANGTVGIGKALANCYYPDGCDSAQAKAKLRRLLACDSVEEVCRIVRPLFSLINSKTTVHLNYIKLLDDLLVFNFKKEKIKASWAQNFYLKTKEDAA